jgi:hypothetical protein
MEYTTTNGIIYGAANQNGSGRWPNGHCKMPMSNLRTSLAENGENLLSFRKKLR